jgi:hypothetical protein
LGGSADIETRIDSVASVLYSLKTSLESLHEYYSKIIRELSIPTSPSTAHLFPYFTSYLNETGSIQRFTYTERLFGRGSRAVFSAKDDDNGRELVVKFTTRYNSRAHKLLADAKLAPILHYHQSIDAPNFRMIVMDKIGQNATELGYEILSNQNYNRISRAIALLHQENYVFGDLRLGNIVIGENEEAFLVDFDWCGEDGVDRYPANLNDNGEIDWAGGVGRGVVMKKAHDLFMLKQLNRS